jgi:hypothetical protein
VALYVRYLTNKKGSRKRISLLFLWFAIGFGISLFFIVVYAYPTAVVWMLMAATTTARLEVTTATVDRSPVSRFNPKTRCSRNWPVREQAAKDLSKQK